MTSKTQIKKRIARKTDAHLVKLIKMLEKHKEPLWHQVARHLAKPKRNAIAVNISKINKLSHDSEIVIVPGKVLGTGELKHNIILAALKYSQGTEAKLGKKANIMTISELAKKKPEFKGINTRIIT